MILYSHFCINEKSSSHNTADKPNVRPTFCLAKVTFKNQTQKTAVWEDSGGRFSQVLVAVAEFQLALGLNEITHPYLHPSIIGLRIEP